jgi:CRP-like cAMP-binding protein
MNGILSPEKVINRLVNQPVFADLDPVSLRVIALAGEIVFLEPGERLFTEGDPSDGAYFILSGFFRLSNLGAQEHSAKESDLLHPLALIADLERPMTATADMPCEVLKIPRQVFIRILDSTPSLALRLRDKLTRDLLHRAQELHPFEQ